MDFCRLTWPNSHGDPVRISFSECLIRAISKSSRRLSCANRPKTARFCKKNRYRRRRRRAGGGGYSKRRLKEMVEAPFLQVTSAAKPWVVSCGTAVQVNPLTDMFAGKLFFAIFCPAAVATDFAVEQSDDFWLIAKTPSRVPDASATSPQLSPSTAPAAEPDPGSPPPAPPDPDPEPSDPPDPDPPDPDSPDPDPTTEPEPEPAATVVVELDVSESSSLNSNNQTPTPIATTIAIAMVAASSRFSVLVSSDESATPKR